ncbi:hypothetical protein [Flavobacterium hibisci]|uniref:hypothetical protein n=1 Tax=Flavobacterium hibisci TaxID=1914462 RepID=UPI001CBC53CC|nr:hypothetical protein [Flavobacterium hibisci]MBZ4041116.1 hypothetical protein [Flavobacterium hibisci]
MKEQLIYFTKITSIAVFSFIKINLLGSFNTIICSTIGAFLLSANVGHAAHTNSGTLILLVFFTSKPIGTTLLLLIFSAPILYLLLGNKYIVSKIIHRLVKDKSESTITPLLDIALAKFKENQPEGIKKGADLALAKIKLLDQVKSEKDNKWLKKIVSFGLKKIKLDDVDFSQDNIDFKDVVKMKTIAALQNSTEPSRKGIFTVLILQWIFLLMIWLIKL